MSSAGHARGADAATRLAAIARRGCCCQFVAAWFVVSPPHRRWNDWPAAAGDALLLAWQAAKSRQFNLRMAMIEQPMGESVRTIVRFRKAPVSRRDFLLAQPPSFRLSSKYSQTDE